MKTLAYFLFMVALLCSCISCKEEQSIGGDVVALGLFVCILDEAFNDRLNPESSSYFGDEFIKNTKITYTADDSKSKYVFPMNESFYLSEEIKPPFRWYENDKDAYYIKENSRGYYYFQCRAGVDTKICYPDGSEDEIKVEIWQSEDTRVTNIGKVWINDELVYERGFYKVKNHYINPKYSPFMKPLYDEDGNIWGELPDYGKFLTLTFIK
jgi:hypothetical protein